MTIKLISSIFAIGMGCHWMDHSKLWKGKCSFVWPVLNRQYFMKHLFWMVQTRH